MKKFFALLLVVCLALPMLAMADGALKIGQVEYAAHGTKCFAVMTAVVQDDVIVACKIEEFQMMPVDSVVAVPNGDNFKNAEGTSVLASKCVNAEYYSGNMTTKAGSTISLDANYAAIEAFVNGKTIAELEEFLAANTKETAVDGVTGCTLVDTYGYIAGLVEAAKAAK